MCEKDGEKEREREREKKEDIPFSHCDLWHSCAWLLLNWHTLRVRRSKKLVTLSLDKYWNWCCVPPMTFYSHLSYEYYSLEGCFLVAHVLSLTFGSSLSDLK